MGHLDELLSTVLAAKLKQFSVALLTQRRRFIQGHSPNRFFGFICSCDFELSGSRSGLVRELIEIFRQARVPQRNDRLLNGVIRVTQNGQ